MRLHYFLIFPLILLTTVWMTRMNSMEESDYWVYDFHESETAYEITRTDARTNTSELITKIPFVADFTLASMMPAEELLVAESFVASHSILRDEEPSAEETYAFFNRPARPRLVSIVPSPDKQTIAMAIQYQDCTRYPRMECFGLVQIVLYTIANAEQRVLWITPLQAQTPFFPSDDAYPYIYSEGSPEVFISNFRWTANQEAIVAQLEYNIYSSCDSPLVFIPVASPENAFTIGNGDIAWATSPDSQEIVALHKNCSMNSLNPESLLSLVAFDNESLISRFSYLLPTLENTLGSDATSAGIVYFQNRIIFQIVLKPRGDGMGDFHRLVSFHPETGEISLIQNLPHKTYRTIRASSESLILQDDEGYLWQLIPSGNSFALEAVTSVPVTYWQFANDDELIIEFAGDDFYSIVDISR